MRIVASSDIVICSTGDLMLCDSPLRVGVGVGSAFKKIRNEIFRPCMKDFAEADLVIGNFESVVYRPKRRNLAELQMSCSEDDVKLLKNIGFSVVNIANNHCLQHGVEAFYHTRDVCRKNGIQAVGAKGDEPYITKIKGVRFVFISLSLLPEMYQPNDIAYENDIENAFHQINKYTEDDDFVIVSIHWGNEFATFPRNRQVELAHRFADSGVDLVLGHHSHVYQGIEKYKNSLILYSQGNLVADMSQTLCRETGYVKIIVSHSNGKRSLSYDMIPLHIKDNFTLEHSDRNWFAERQQQLQSVLNHKISDKQYWHMVDSNHARSSGEYKKQFRRDLRKYRPNILVRMIYEAVHRKIFKIKRSDQFATEKKPK